MDWIGRNAGKVLAIGACLALVLAIVTLRSCGDARTAKVREDLANGQRGAAIGSGADAVKTIGNSVAAEAAIQSTVKEGTDAIHDAPGGDSNDAADRAACRLRSYRHSSKCVTLLGPVAE